jgi:hypothetical protein
MYCAVDALYWEMCQLFEHVVLIIAKMLAKSRFLLANKCQFDNRTETPFIYYFGGRAHLYYTAAGEKSEPQQVDYNPFRSGESAASYSPFKFSRIF